MRKYKDWNSVEDKLPKAGRWVQIRLDGHRYHDIYHKKPKPTIIVAKIAKGLSLKDRELMAQGKMKSPPDVGGWSNNSENEFVLTYSPRYEAYMSEDEHGNNLVPYCWEGKCGDEYYGQEVNHWKELNG